MDIEYVRDLNRSYMIVKKEEEEDRFELRMLANNRIEGLLPFRENREGAELSLWYDISSRQSLDCYLEMNPLDKDFLRRLIRALLHLGEALSPYLLDQNHLLLDPETVYVKNDGKEFCFCYFPSEEGDIRESFRELMEFLLQKVDHRNEALRTAVYGIYQTITSQEYRLTDLLSGLEEQKDFIPEPELPEPEEAPKQRAIRYPEENPKQRAVRYPEENPKQRVIRYPEDTPKKAKKKLFLPVLEKKKKEEKEPEMEPVFFEREEGERVEEATTFISLKEEGARGELRYLGHGTERNLLITDSPFFIGTREGLAGKLDSQAVSRQHAKITRTPEGYVLQDLNSTNGTCRNGESLHYREKILLKPKDHILFADEEFLFL